ncbi:MAG: FHA domain-containing protein [Verrucomicrobiaceae bacterium]|nr:FHA domain-containing protein [Verrucomicrobiaceae bacterium]
MSSRLLHNLVVELPDCPPRYYQLNSATIRLGRVEGNAIVVTEDAVSARHCELRRTAAGGYEVRDLESTNGTRLNGETLGPDPRALRDGDTLLLGGTARVRFVRVHEIHDRVPAAPAKAGSVTMRLERPAINPVAAAVAKAARANAK